MSVTPRGTNPSRAPEREPRTGVAAVCHDQLDELEHNVFGLHDDRAQRGGEHPEHGWDGPGEDLS